jgi:hypothetical protein
VGVGHPRGRQPLVETFSRNSAQELRNGGYDTTSLYRYEVDKDLMRRLLPEQDVFLWEGHHSTLIKDFQFDKWDEPLRPSLFFLQSCLALSEAEAQPLLRRGAVAVVGTSTRTYSGSGGAFALAFMDGMLYERQSLGGSLRQAKNFLLCYGKLKEKRLDGAAKLTGANVRAAWAFTLWGDPTLTLPPAADSPTLAPVRCEAGSRDVVLKLPPTQYPLVSVGDYEAKMRPNARLAGLIHADEDGKRLVPFLFAEVSLPDVPDGQTPRLACGRLHDRDWVFAWDARRKRGYLLVTPRPHDEREIRFKVQS